MIKKRLVGKEGREGGWKGLKEGVTIGEIPVGFISPDDIAQKH